MPLSPTFDINQANNVLKLRYTQKKVKTNAYLRQPFFGMVKKNTDGGGLNWSFAVHIGSAQTRAVTLPSAQASQANAGAASQYRMFNFNYFEDYATANFSGRMIDASKNDSGSFINVLSTEMDRAIGSLSRSIGISLFRNGGGARGQISATSNVGTPTITLANPADITNFEVGMAVRTSATDGTSGSVRAGTVFIIGVSRSAGTITVSTTLTGTALNWTNAGGIPTAAALDYIFQDGDFGAMTPGVAGIIPPTDPTSTLFGGVDRTADTNRLAGLRYNGGGGAYEETLIDALALMSREGQTPDAGFMHPQDIAVLAKALSGKVIYERLGSSKDEPSIGFSGVRLVGPEGPVEIYPDINVPKGTVFLLTMNTWELMSMGDAPKLIEGTDGLKVRAVYNADSYEARFVTRQLLWCSNPIANCNVTL
jgi:hypothetical protein